MKLRRTSARVAHQEAVKIRTEVKEEYDTGDDAATEEDNLVFTQIVEPFSPVHSTHCDEDEDNSWSLLPMKSTSQNFFKDKKIVLKPKTKKKTPAKRNYETMELDTNVELELETLINDDSKISDVREVLEQYPVFFVKAYIKYLHASKDSNTSKVAVPKKKNIIPYSVVKNNNASKKCVICRQEFKGNRMLAKHMRQHSSSDGYTCICSKEWKDFKGFWTHVVKIHGQMYKCPYCDMTFEGLVFLRDHSKKVHSPSHAYVCALCNKGFSKEFRFLEHINYHTGLKPHQCHLCGRTYRCNDARREHVVMRHSGSEMKCSQCGKVFLCKRTFGDHMLSHGTERKYVCKECGKSFKTRAHLAKHKVCHKSARFPCASCPFTFKTDDGLKKHCKRQHNGPVKEKQGNRKNKDSIYLENKVNSNSHKDTPSEKQECQKNNFKGITSLSTSPSAPKTTSRCNFRGIVDDSPAFLDSYELQVNSEPLNLCNGISIVNEIERDSSDDETSGAILLSL